MVRELRLGEIQATDRTDEPAQSKNSRMSGAGIGFLLGLEARTRSSAPSTDDAAAHANRRAGADRPPMHHGENRRRFAKQWRRLPNYGGVGDARWVARPCHPPGGRLLQTGAPMIRHGTTTLAWVLAAWAQTAAAPEPSQPAILDRVRSYVTAWQEQLSGLVVHETYIQRLTQRFGRTIRQRTESDVALVRVRNAWVGFRDVAEVDGHPIAGRNERLLDLFVNHPLPEAVLQARRISEEGARYNLGQLYRNFNVPTTALQILEPGRTDRVSFRVDGETKLDGQPATKIDYQELRSPSLIFYKSARRYIFTQGRLWVDKTTGRVLATEMRWKLSSSRDQANLNAVVTVRYHEDATTRIWVPAAMTEKYDTGAELIDAHADYTEIRRFSVVVTDDMTLPQ
jgi:hypothetical protein